MVRRLVCTKYMFQSTPSGGKATLYCRVHCLDSMFQSTPSGGKATLLINTRFAPASCFNPRLPGGRRPYRPLPSPNILKFQSTPSGGKATQIRVSFSIALPKFQSTPSGGKATLRPSSSAGTLAVSIHAFRGEGDVRSTSNTASPSRFQSTPSGGKAT